MSTTSLQGSAGASQHRGIAVDPARVREARRAAGLSLAEVAGGEVSRTLIHFIEHGRTRPSERVLELIALRTGKPVSYFVLHKARGIRPADAPTLASELSAVALHVRRFVSTNSLIKSDREAMERVEEMLEHAARLTKSVERRA